MCDEYVRVFLTFDRLLQGLWGIPRESATTGPTQVEDFLGMAHLGTHTDHTAPVQFDKLFEIEGQAIRVFNWAGSH